MKTNFLIKALFLPVIFMGLMGCEKEDVTNSNNTNDSQNILKSSEDREEYDNYFEDLAGDHNDCLDYVANNCNVSSTSREDRFIIAKNFTESDHNWEDIENMGDSLMDNIESSSSITNLMDSMYFSTSALNLVDDLNDIFDEAVNQEESTVYTPEKFNTEIDSLIDYIYENYEVELNMETKNGNEYALIIGGCFIAKASYEYWYNASHNSTHKWYPFFHSSRSNIFQRIWHAVKVAAVDTWGFISAGDCLTVEYEEPGNVNGKLVYDLVCAWDHAGEQSSSVPEP